MRLAIVRDSGGRSLRPQSRGSEVRRTMIERVRGGMQREGEKSAALMRIDIRANLKRQ